MEEKYLSIVLANGQAAGYTTEMLIRFLKDLLISRKIAAVLAPKRYAGGGNAAPVLISDHSRLEGVDPLAPVQMINAAQALVELTKDGLDRPVAALLRPCEVRASIELMKLRQVNREKLILIGYDCPGVYNLPDYRRLVEQQGKREDSRSFVAGHCRTFLEDDDPTLREACRLCAHFTADSADMALSWIGLPEGALVMRISGEDMISLPGGWKVQEAAHLEEREKQIRMIRERRRKQQDQEVGNLLRLLDPCLRCYSCREVCPLCYCKECLLQPEKLGYTTQRYLARADSKGQIKFPVDTLLYHLTKMNHMSFSCVGCGVCEQACPVDIPLGRIYHRIGRDVQALFSYEPGRSLEEDLPVTTFREEELPDVEDIKRR